jgi:hypothetical protein
MTSTVPPGREPLCTPIQALRAWLRSACPSRTKANRPSKRLTMILALLRSSPWEPPPHDHGRGFHLASPGTVDSNPSVSSISSVSSVRCLSPASLWEFDDPPRIAKQTLKTARKSATNLHAPLARSRKDSCLAAMAWLGRLLVRCRAPRFRHRDLGPTPSRKILEWPDHS